MSFQQLFIRGFSFCQAPGLRAFNLLTNPYNSTGLCLSPAHKWAKSGKGSGIKSICMRCLRVKSANRARASMLQTYKRDQLPWFARHRRHFQDMRLCFKIRIVPGMPGLGNFPQSWGIKQQNGTIKKGADTYVPPATSMMTRTPDA